MQGKNGDLQDYNENANIRIHFSIMFFLHPKALIYTIFLQLE